MGKIKYDDLSQFIGNEFGFWLVIGIGELKYNKNGYKIKTLRCKCTCGLCDNTIRDVKLYNLIAGKSSNCGKSNNVKYKNLNNYIGKTFGDWLVIGVGKEKVKKYKDTITRKKYLRCKCNCGYCNNIVREVSISELVNNNSKSCGRKKLKKYNEYDLSGEYGVGWALNTNKEFYFDLEDYDKIKDYTWNSKSSGYIQTTITRDGKTKYIYMHNLVMNSDIRTIDHINRIKHDNKKQNLRYYDTISQNVSNISIRKNNTSGIIGVCWKKANNKWQASIQWNKRNYYLGLYDDIEDAIRIRLQAEKNYFGEFAPQTHLFEQYNIN